MPIQIDLGSDSSAASKKIVSSGPVVGIDLGTTHSLVARCVSGDAKILKSSHGHSLVPSIVEVSDQGAVVSVGEIAKERAISRPSNVVSSVKRLMGRSFADLKNEAMLFPYKIVADSAGLQAQISVGSVQISPVQVSAEILRVLKVQAQTALGQTVERAVITVPAYFDDGQRQATRAAGKLAGLDVLRVINEPTAAALAYGWDQSKPGTVVVYDLGGGTFDVSILRIEENIFEVLATAGDTRLGGDDFDWLLVEHFVQSVGLDRNVFSGENKVALKSEAERVKIELSEKLKSVFRCLGFELAYDRQQVGEIWWPLAKRTLESCARALEDARLKPDQIHDVLMVGGSTRMPMIRAMVSEFFGKPVNTSLNPDEAVAIGAAHQAAVLEGQSSNNLLLDVIPLSLGIETMGGAVSKLISRNSTIPTEAREVYTNHSDKQTAFDIHVVQGERELVKDCRSLARFKLRGLETAPAGFHRIEVLFRIDANGILNVRATDLRTKRRHEIEVRPSFGISDDELVHMLEVAMDKAEDDIHARQWVDLKIEAETVSVATEKALQNAGHLVSNVEQAEIRARLVDLRNAMKGSNLHLLRTALEQLTDVTNDLAELQVNAALGQALSKKSVEEM